ncbi:Calcium-binding mitochondrial carrier protein Aralar1 [Eumeta japonica]|uniref:Calcium-binding mitochondrial carrier protein Aralar1 n=1 Tax=Eumeta variegata TaxID=151549 RepID=A0A4C2AGB7_EUMVA|nr:Calcium-binding mitochondrial carrier protein Aralar1 [Eumeta japonica]
MYHKLDLNLRKQDTVPGNLGHMLEATGKLANGVPVYLMGQLHGAHNKPSLAWVLAEVKLSKIQPIDQHLYSFGKHLSLYSRLIGGCYNHPLTLLAAGAIAGVPAASLVTPADVIKPVYKSSLDQVKQLIPAF